MNYLSVENISKSYGERILFQDLFFGLSKGDKMALIANNGTGKSSMLKIIAGKDVTESGKITLRNGIRIGYLEQDPLFNEGFTVKEFLENSNSDVMQIIRDYDKALELQTDDFNDATSQRFQEASDLMDKANAWNFNNELNQILTRFKILDLTQNLKDLSGGQRKRLSLALLILDKPELLLLDEPTNHLDIEMIEWLEEYLKNQNITLLMITHDRYFLDRVCNHILELEDGKLYHHKGNYSYFLLKREEREENFNTEISKAGRLMKKELDEIEFPDSVDRIEALIEEEKVVYKMKNYLPQHSLKQSKGAFHQKQSKNMKVNRAQEKRRARMTEKKKAKRKKKS